MSKFLDYINKLQENNINLKEISFANDPISSENITTLINALSGNKYLKILELNNNELSFEQVKALAEVLEKNQTLETLSLRSCKIGDKGAEVIAEAIKHNYNLKQLYLGNNSIADDGVLAFAKILTLNVALEVLSFRNNLVSLNAAKALAQSLEINATLKTLNLANTELSDEAASAFLYTLLFNTTLKEIKLNYNNIENTEILVKIKEALNYNKSQNVIAINALAKKIVRFCEKYFEFKESNQNDADLEQQIIQEYGLNREDRYHLSTKNIHGGATLCLALVFNIFEAKYSAEGLKIMIETTNKLCDLFIKVEQELKDKTVKKPNEKIIEIANRVIKSYSSSEKI